MGFRTEEMEFPALGRPAFLGQLYSASSERLLNIQMFDARVLERVQTVRNSFTRVTYKDVNSISDRANALDITAELSVGILAGLIDLKGSGQYLDTRKSNVSSREVSMVCFTRKNMDRLDLRNNDRISMEEYERAVMRRASHVVTGIIYGGTLITNVVKKVSSSDVKETVQGQFSASIMKNMAAVFSVRGKAAVDSDQTSKDIFQSHDFEFYGDYSASDQANPTTIGDVFELAKKWPELVGDGIPCLITVTPLDQLVDRSVVGKIIRQLESDELAAILTDYDQIYRLAGRRARMKAVLEDESEKLSAFYPTFSDACRQRKNVVDGILSRSRKALSRYLIAYRDGGRERAGEVEEFLDGIKNGLDEHLKNCNQDESTLGLLRGIHSLSIGHNVPLATLNELRSLMTRVNHGVLGVVLIPPSPSLDGAINTFEVLVADIRRWRADEDKKDCDANGKARETIFISFYCDSACTAGLLQLDGKKGVLKKALDGFDQSKEPRFVHYGALSDNLIQKRFDWSLLNDEGWGFLHNEKEYYRYVGQVSGGKRQGRGTVTYANGATYSGDWWQDKKHGKGDLVENSQHTSGIFINDQYRADGVIVDLTIFSRHVPVGTAKIPLRRGDSTTAHVRMIGNMLGWTDADKHKLVVECATDRTRSLEVFVVGRLIEHGQDDMIYKSWPLDQTVEIKAERRA
ncbi:hypothetical protein L218DRAFT_949662 [Marasmius fiardii PR-910]|nr:hypothetical protein L218DRAFT_949662 [Marasmius fiardii PR-910]